MSVAVWRDGDGARTLDASDPAMVEAVGAQCRAYGARQMGATLAPVEARPAQDAAALGGRRLDVHARAVEQGETAIGNLAGIEAEFNMTGIDQRIGDRYPEMARQVVIAGAPCPQRHVARTGAELSDARFWRGDAHDAFDHLRHGRRCKPVVAMATLFLDEKQSGLGHFRQMTARRLCRDTGKPREFRCCQHTAIHQTVEHAGTARITGQRRYFRKSCIVRHDRFRGFRLAGLSCNPQENASELVEVSSRACGLYRDHSNCKGVTTMTITCFIQYDIDPYQKEAFEEYARNWNEAIPRCGADLIGYYAPHEGSATLAYAAYNIESLAAYEAYRARLKADPVGRANYEFAREKRFIRREDRTFLHLVTGKNGGLIR